MGLKDQAESIIKKRGRPKKNPEEMPEEQQQAVIGALTLPDSVIHGIHQAVSGDSGDGQFQPAPRDSGVEQDGKLDDYTTNRLLGLYFEPSDKLLPTVTHTPRQMFEPIVVAEAIDEIRRLGSKRTQSIAQIYLLKRDRRAPSIDGDSRNGILHVNDMRASDQDNGAGSMNW